MDVWPVLVVVGVLGALALMSWRDSRDYAAFKLLTKSADRIRFYRRWTIVPLAVFGIGGTGLLLAFGRIDALWYRRVPPWTACCLVVCRVMPRVAHAVPKRTPSQVAARRQD